MRPTFARLCKNGYPLCCVTARYNSGIVVSSSNARCSAVASRIWGAFLLIKRNLGYTISDAKCCTAFLILSMDWLCGSEPRGCPLFLYYRRRSLCLCARIVAGYTCIIQQKVSEEILEMEGSTIQQSLRLSL